MPMEAFTTGNEKIIRKMASESTFIYMDKDMKENERMIKEKERESYMRMIISPILMENLKMVRNMVLASIILKGKAMKSISNFITKYGRMGV